jgi:hypothetical protein
MPLGGGGGGAGLAANNSRICLSSFSISSSFDIISPIYIAAFPLLTSFVLLRTLQYPPKVCETTKNIARNRLLSEISLHIRT